MREGFAGLAMIGFGVFLANACARPDPAAPVPLPSPGLPARLVPSAAVAEPSRSAAVAVAEPGLPPSAPPPMGPRRGSEGSTRGTISCGTSRCVAGKEACIANALAGQWICVPSSDPLMDGGYRCDDGTDCPDGETCCESFASAATFVGCTKRTEDCAVELCEPGGARCPPGQVCRDGHCGVPTRASCGKQVCSGDKPFCIWGKEAKCGDSTAASAADESLMSGEQPSVTGVFICTRRADCGTLQCCSSALGPQRTFCANQCDSANSHVICDKDSDCRSLSEVYCPGRSCATCRPAEDERMRAALPPWMKLCVMAD